MINLNDIPKKNGFKVPEEYFEQLDAKIKNNIKDYISSKPTTFDIIKPYIYAVASVLILALGIPAGLKYFVDKPKISVVSQTENLSYLDIYFYRIESDEFIFKEVMDDSDYEYYTENSISEDEIEDYLSNYYIEYEMFNE